MAGRTVKKDNGTWYFVLTFGKNDNGKPKQYKKRGYKTKQEALNAINELEHSLMKGTYIKPTKTRYSDYMINQWLEDKQTMVKKQTLKVYDWLITTHVLPTLGHFELAELTPMAIQKLYNKLTKEQALSDENIQKIHTLINDSLKKAERWGLIAKNPASLVDRPKAVRKEVRVWDVNEVKMFLNHGDNDSRYFIAFVLALTTGMRQGEILGLRWKDVDMENFCIHVTQTLSNDGKELLPYTKTKSGSRKIDLPDQLILQLKKHKELVDEEKLKYSDEYHDLDLVVCTKLGEPTNKSNLRRVFNSAIKRSGVSKCRFHDMRHTHATLLLLQGTNPKIVSERLGHATTRLTLDTYSHLLPSMQKETAAKFGELLFD